MVSGFFFYLTQSNQQRESMCHTAVTLLKEMYWKPVNYNTVNSKDFQVIHFLWQKEVKIILDLKINGDGGGDALREAPQ